MHLIRRKPVHVLPSLSNLVDDFFKSDVVENKEKFVVPPVNIKEQNNAFAVEMALPGVSKDDIEIAVDSGVLSVSSRKTEKSEDEQKGGFWKREFSFSSFKRLFKLPKSVDQDNIKADYQDGVLKIDIPKLEKEDKVKRIDIS